MMNKNLKTMAFAGLATLSAGTAGAGLLDMSQMIDDWGVTGNGTFSSGTTYTTTIDGIETLFTFQSNGGDLWVGVSDNGIMGIDSDSDAIPAIESRANEILTVTITPTTATGITYTVVSGQLAGAGANSGDITMAFTNADGTTTYASTDVGANDVTGDLAFSPALSGVDSVSFSVRQTVTTGDTTEGGFLGDFTVTAVPEPSSLALIGAGGLLLLRRRRG